MFPFLLRRRACFYKIREDTLIASRGRRRVKANKKMAEELVITRRQSLERASNRAVPSLHKVRNVLATFDTNISRDTCLFSKERSSIANKEEKQLEISFESNSEGNPGSRIAVNNTV